MKACVDCGGPRHPHAKARCLNCHHAYVASQEPAHGSRSRYNGGCRCQDCRDANTAYTRRWRQRTGGQITPEPSWRIPAGWRQTA